MAFKQRYNSQQSLPYRLNTPYADLRPAIAQGRAISQIGNVITEWSVMKQKQRDAAVVAEAYNEFRDMTREEVSRLFQLEGRDATALGQQYDQFFENASNEFLSKRFETGRQQTEFGNLAQRVRQNDLDNLAQREAAEHQRYKVEVYKSHLATIVADVRENPFNDEARQGHLDMIFGYTDSTFAGHDNRLRKQEAESMILAAAVQEMINIDPGRAEKYLEQWGPEKLGDAYTKFKNKLEGTKNQTMLDAAYSVLFAKYGENYEAAIDDINNPAKWDELYIDGKMAEILHERFTGLRNYREKLENEAEANLNERIKDNDLQAWIDFNNGELSIDELTAMARRRDISEATYRGIYDSQIRDVKENNAIVIGEINENLSFGKDIKQDLIDARNKGQIKTETFISLMNANADSKRKRGYKYINDMMKPTEADKWSEDRHIKYAEAVDLYNSRLAEEQEKDDFSPIKIAKEIVNSYHSDLRREYMNLPKPKFLAGKPDSFSDLSVAMEKTIAAYAKGDISKAQYDSEMKAISAYLKLIREQEAAAKIKVE